MHHWSDPESDMGCPAAKAALTPRRFFSPLKVREKEGKSPWISSHVVIDGNTRFCDHYGHFGKNETVR
jgi:hypothetical protein